MSKAILPPTTAAIDPAAFPQGPAFVTRKVLTFLLIASFLLAGFLLRTYQLGTESLGEDELNKLETVTEYRENGLSGKNGEHPFLMKGLQTASLIAAESWNSVAGGDLKVSDEAALRFPIALFGTFSLLLIYLLTSALFGRPIGLIAAGLWAVEPMAIGFDRIAKEDSLVVFFFLLTQVLWVRSQTEAQRDNSNWIWYAWGSASAFAALMASKYYPHLLAISGAYYNIYKYVSTSRWNMRSKKWFIYFVVMGVTFLVLNPTIMLPDTWREMLKFSSENRIGHDSYEYMGHLYRNQMSAWLSGVPWTFYYVFFAVKASLSTIVFALIGIPLMFRRKMGDGRFLIFFWAFMWFLPFTFLGGKFTRYFAFVTPLILILAAVGTYYTVRWLAESLKAAGQKRSILEASAFALVLIVPLVNSVSVAPHYRLFTNTIGGGIAAAGNYFPHDEFYDAATETAMRDIARLASPGAVIATETPGVFEFYARKLGRNDLRFVSLSNKADVSQLAPNDFVVITRGRRYLSNTSYIDYLKDTNTDHIEFRLGEVPAGWLYRLNETTAEQLRNMARDQS